jgi:hypothetical protein
MKGRVILAALAPALLIAGAALPLFGADRLLPVRSAKRSAERSASSAPSPGRPRAGLLQARPAAAPATVREFEFRGVMFAVPASWKVQRADQDPFRVQYVTVTGGPNGPHLRFSDVVQLLGNQGVAGRRPASAGRRSGSALSLERYEMPNASMRGVVYLIPEAGISITAHVRTDAEARAADQVVQSARWVLPSRGPARS